MSTADRPRAAPPPDTVAVRDLPAHLPRDPAASAAAHVWRVIDAAYRFEREGAPQPLIVESLDESEESPFLESPPGDADPSALARTAASLAAAADRIGLDLDVVRLEPAAPPARAPTIANACRPGRTTLLVAPRFGPETPRPPQPPWRPLRVALAGFGVVGAGVRARLALEPRRFEVVSILVRDPAKRRAEPAAPELLTAEPDALFAARPDIVVDALSSGETGLAITRRALLEGVHVASANKQALVGDLPNLRALAGAHGVALAYSAAVGGGCPMVETVRRAAAHGEIAEVEAVLNGTVNFILERMARGVAFEPALEEARRAGFADEDPSADLDGLDAAAKIRILALEAMGEAPSDDATPRAPLDRSAQANVAKVGGSWKQIGRAWRDGASVRAHVRLARADDDPAFADTRGEGNVIRVRLADGGVRLARGRGAGRHPTSQAVIADLVDIARRSAPPG